MKLKRIVLFTFFNIIVLNTFSQESENKQEQGYVKSYDLLKSIQGNWKLVHLLVDNMEVDCEHLEKSLLKQLDTDKNNQAMVTEEFNTICKANESKIINVSHNSIVDKNLNRITFFKLDNNLEENIIIIDKKHNKVKLKIKKINDTYFKLLHSNKKWLKFKRITD